MSRHHYHVLQGLRGCYMPDSNTVWTNKRKARAFAREEAEATAEDMECSVERCSADYYSIGEYNCVQVTICTAADCLEHAND